MANKCNTKSNLNNKLAFVPKCHKCNTKYDIHKVITIAEQKNTKQIQCHKCNVNIGKL
jgi:DNA-directed RNA polymerase subunit RPC12/RpoP